MGAADDVDVAQFGRDLEALFASLNDVQPDIVLAETAPGVATAAVSVDDDQITDVLLKLVQLADRNGIKLPREFGLLVKQALYFDRYTRLLAPEMDVLRDDRLKVVMDRAGALDV